MPTVRKRGNTWRVEVKLKGKRYSATRDTKAEALAWATAREAEILAGHRGQIIPQRVYDALDKYAQEVSPSKGGARWERVRLAKLGRTLPFRGLTMADVRPLDIAGWRDEALASGLAPNSVRREMTLLRTLFERAKREWCTVAQNPFDGVSYPKMAAPRTRRVTDEEIAKIQAELGWDGQAPAVTVSQRIAVAMAWAVETAMRAGEIIGLAWADIDRDKRTAFLPRTKNGDARKVPLTRRALALLDCLPPGDGLVFALKPATRDVLFRKARDRVGLSDLHFHDLRAEALTRMSQKVDVLTLARIAGHRDVKSLLVYYRESIEDIAARLD